jgi:CubicO group peptidase (beta-lactamase class C family)
MKLIQTIVFFVFALELCSCSTQKNIEKLDISINSIYKKSNFPGFAIAIIKEDSIVFSKGYGFADIVKKTPYTIETIQPIASVSKTFVALSVMKAIELGYFTLESNINDLLPFKIVNPNFPNGIITVKQLTNHTSSLLDNDTTRFKTYSLGTKPIMELGVFLKEYYSPNGKYYTSNNFSSFAIGTNYAYSNIAAALMAYIIEVTSKMDFTSFTNKYIFSPLKMLHTKWFYEDSDKSQIATLYQITKPENALYYNLMNEDKSLKQYCFVTYPDGSLQTSVSDLTLFLKCMMNGFFSKNANLINGASYQTLFSKQFSEKNMPTNMDAKEPNRAIFWSYSKKGDIRHTGSSPGVFAFLSFDPITKIGRIMTLNGCLEGDENNMQVENFKKIIEAITTFEKSLK